MPSAAVLPHQVESRYPHGYAVVDVETTGLSATYHRVLQIAVVQLDAGGRVQREWTTLLDPGCDPGPVHIHGLTRERLAGAPGFLDVAATLHELVADRVLVAHNARFDWQFLVAESGRVSRDLPVRQRLCTIALSRRLDLPLASMSLASVASYWGVAQTRAHDAVDDTRVLVEVLRHSLVVADRLGAALPLAACDGTQVTRPAPASAPRTPCAWQYAGRWSPSQPLVQGMKVVFTGETTRPREVLIADATAAGLDVMNSVSSRTSVVVRNVGSAVTRKAEAAAQHRTPVIDEASWLQLVRDVRPGTAKTNGPATKPTTAPATSKPVPRTNGPLQGRRVLVLGGPHTAAAAARERVVEAGGQAAANLTASVTHIVELEGAQADPRSTRTAGLPRLDAATLQPVGTEDVPATTEAPSEPVVLGRGVVTDLPADLDDWSLSVSWPDSAGPTITVDVVAFVLDAHEQVRADQDFCFFNQPVHPDGSVELDLDTAAEALAVIRPSRLPDEQQRIVFAAALDDERTFGEVGPIELALRTPEGELVARSTLDAATTEQSMLLASLYNRNGTWRFRAVGQGYDTGLAHLAVLHGVDIED